MPDEERWVEVEWIVLPAGERAPNLPADTRLVPYMARTRGLSPVADPGAQTTVTTPSGRRIAGRLVAVEPGYDHSFGHPPVAWTTVRESIRRLVSTAHGAAPSHAHDDAASGPSSG